MPLNATEEMAAFYVEKAAWRRNIHAHPTLGFMQ